MRSSLFPALLLLGALSGPAQEPDKTSIYVPGPPPYTQLKSYLNLTDAQVQSLLQIQTRRSEAERQIYQQIWEKQSAAYELIRNDSNDALKIGQLFVEAQQLQKKLPTNNDAYRTEALNLLTADQKTKLSALDGALKLQQPAWEAVNLNLLAQPVSPDPRILAMPAVMGGAEINRTLPAPVPMNAPGLYLAPANRRAK